jgi:hypothetical protein
MNIIIDNQQRIFLVKYQNSITRDYFCNLHHIPKIIKRKSELNNNYIILEYWNKKFKRISEKRLNDMFTINQIKFKINNKWKQKLN